MSGKVLKIWRRYALPFSWYLRKNTGGGAKWPPPNGARVKLSNIVVIYIKDDVRAVVLKTKTSPGQSHLEPLWLKIKLDKKRVSILGGLYRSPSSNSRQIHADYNNLEEELQAIIASHPSNRIILTGDMNSDAKTNPEAYTRLTELSKYGLQ